MPLSPEGSAHLILFKLDQDIADPRLDLAFCSSHWIALSKREYSAIVPCYMMLLWISNTRFNILSNLLTVAEKNKIIAQAKIAARQQ